MNRIQQTIARALGLRVELDDLRARVVVNGSALDYLKDRLSELESKQHYYEKIATERRSDLSRNVKEIRKELSLIDAKLKDTRTFTLTRASVAEVAAALRFASERLEADSE